MEQAVLQLEDFVANNELDLALKKLQSIFSLSNSELVNDVILLAAQFRKLHSDVRKGIIDYTQENLTHNKISNAILSLIKEIKNCPNVFAELTSVEKELDQSVKEKTNEELSIEIKDALFERLTYIKGKEIVIKAIWIDDFPSNNIYESKILSLIGIQIDIAKSSDEGYKMIKKNSYEIILSDISRNGISDEGIRFHRQLIGENIDIPLIFYTGFADRSKGVPPYAFGIVDLPNELIHLVLDVIERKY